MKIAIPTFQFKRGGGITYLKQILPLFSQLYPEHTFVIYAPKRHDFIEQLGLGKNIQIVYRTIPLGMIGRVLYEQLILPIELMRDDIDVLFSTGDITSLLAPCPVVLAVRNPNPYYKRVSWSRYRKFRLFLLRLHTHASIIKAYAVFFVSDASRKRVQSILNVPMKKLSTIYHGMNHDLFNAHKKPLAHGFQKYVPYILSVSTINPHKNFETLIKAYAKLPEKVIDAHHMLVVGKFVSTAYEQKIKRLVAQQNLENRIIFTGPVPLEDLPAVYQNAAVFVLPSLLETFGHPLVEAMASGAPVIASKSTSNPEILGGAGRLFKTTDPESLAKKLESVLKSQSTRDALREKGIKRAQDFSWEQSAQQAMKLITNAHTDGKKT